jgi:hypothetical protein
MSSIRKFPTFQGKGLKTEENLAKRFSGRGTIKAGPKTMDRLHELAETIRRQTGKRPALESIVDRALDLCGKKLEENAAIWWDSKSLIAIFLAAELLAAVEYVTA